MMKIKMKIFRVAFLLTFLLAEFFGFGSLQKVYAACSYNIDSFFTSNGQTTAAPDSTIYFTGTVSTKAGKLNECTGKQIILYLNFDNYRSFKDDYVANSGPITLTTDVNKVTTNLSVDLGNGNYDLSGLNNQVVFKLALKEWTGTGSDINPTITASAPVTINLSTAPPNNPNTTTTAPPNKPTQTTTQPPAGAAAGAQPGAGASQPAGANPSTPLYNPLHYDDLTKLLVGIMKGFLGILGVWAVAFIVIGGFRMVISSGNEEAVAAAKKTILWAVLGLVVAVLSFAIIIIVQNIIGIDVQPAFNGLINSLV